MPESRRTDVWVVVAMGGMLLVPAALTLLRVAEPRPVLDPEGNPTPLGYTWSLLLFLVPVAVLAGWLLKRPGLTIPRKALWKTLAVLSPLGIVLDLLFGNAFFVFPNEGAVLGIHVPAVGGPIPIEEIVFYVSGFLVVLLLYTWTDEYWLAAYNVPDYRQESEKLDGIVRFDGRALAMGVVLLAFAVAYKKTASEVPQGFPWYFTYLLGAAIVPSMGLYRSVAGFINWRAFSFTFFFLLLVSLLWEATLGVPYGWWDYNKEMMLGLFVDAWSELPLEAVLVWLAVTYTSVVLYEAIKIYQASGKSWRRAFLG